MLGRSAWTERLVDKSLHWERKLRAGARVMDVEDTFTSSSWVADVRTEMSIGDDSNAELCARLLGRVGVRCRGVGVAVGDIVVEGGGQMVGGEREVVADGGRLAVAIGHVQRRRRCWQRGRGGGERYTT